jgi:copper chaperone CopZ
MGNKFVNISLIVLVALVLVGSAFFVRIGNTADAVVCLKTSGMTCGGCANRVTQALQSVKGVASTDVDVAHGCVIAGYDSKLVTPAKLAQKVAAAGYPSEVQSVQTPEQYRKTAGRDLLGQSCGCGSKTCAGR